MTITQALFDAAFTAGTVRYPSDCDLIMSIALSRLNVRMSRRQAEEVWESWSDRMDAQWLSVFAYDGNEVVEAIQWFVKKRLQSELGDD